MAADWSALTDFLRGKPETADSLGRSRTNGRPVARPPSQSRSRGPHTCAERVETPSKGFGRAPDRVRARMWPDGRLLSVVRTAWHSIS